ncbi:hypothetical protein HA402_005565 [Bradysia odoriphaga]|nr:hypothetical protein HA402_005565 [Bradysia odoriphaga]
MENVFNLHPATGIEFSITCRFFNNSEENIFTGGANVLKVFRIIPDVDPTNATEKFSDHLKCMCTYTLYGNIMSLQSVSLAGSQRDALLISFKDAKLSVVQHDPDTFELKTPSLHYFQEDDIKGGWTSNYHIPMVRVDSDNRCAVMVAYGKKLVVLPFRRDSSLDEIELQDVKPMKKTPVQVQLIAKTPILASYIIILKDLDEKIDNNYIVMLPLDAAQVAFIDYDKLVLSLQGGELYVLTLYADSMRSVRSFHFSKAASSVLTSCASFSVLT